MRPTVDVSSLEADMAFFEARLSLAGNASDSLYQAAQVKTYETLGHLIGERLKTLKAAKPAKKRG